MYLKMYLKAYFLAKRLHKGQLDKAGKPYFSHPKAVSRMCNTKREKVVALLHDTLEDTDITFVDLCRMFDFEIAEAVEHLTHREGETYEVYLHRVAKSPLAARVKLADLLHNMQLSRLPEVTEADIRRALRYSEAYRYLILEAYK